ncbi:MAG TPA: FAD:protein FMN transferase [Myxococcota bacterium]|nr:FAD:protein FMN transferase [Myxococcota bacterium]
MRRRALGLAAAWAVACARPETNAAPDARTVCPVQLSDGQYRMGTVLEVTLCAPDRATGERLLRETFEGVAALEQSFSSFDPKSELSALNRAAGRGPQRVSSALLRLTADSLALSTETDGSFDVTVGPLVALWKAASDSQRLPPAAELLAARARVGGAGVAVDAAAGTVELRRAGASLDFGGIAKGWALDRAGERLRAAGVTRALLSFGESSILAIGSAPGWDGWGIALTDASGAFAGTVELRDVSLSTSGSLGQYVEIEGRRYGHVIDPRSGEPLSRARVAVVLAADGAQAEALSKALLILGEQAGVAKVESAGAQGLLLDESGAHVETAGWAGASHYARDWPPRKSK